VLIIIVFSIPSVQTYVAHKVTQNLNETYGTNINIDRLGLNWKGEVDIRRVYIQDHHSDTLIFAKVVQTNILNFQNLVRGELGFGDLHMEDAKLYVTTYRGEETDNLSFFAQKFDTGKPPSANPFSLFSNDVSLETSHIKITNYNLESPEMFALRDVNLEATRFNILGPVIEANIESLSLVAERGFKIQDLQADFYYSPEQMEFEDLVLRTESSRIQGTILLDYAERGMADFANDVMITAQLENSEIATNDLNAFYNEFGSDLVVAVEGELQGSLNNFTFSEAQLQTENTFVSGNFNFENLLTPNTPYRIEANQHEIQTSYYNLRRFMPRILGDVMPNQLKSLGSFSLRGTTTLNGTNLSTDAAISTSIGDAEVKASLTNIDNVNDATYTGDILLKRFNLGKLLNMSSMGTTTANLTVDGSGFTQNTVNTEIDGTISSFHFEGYKYTNISVSGNLKSPIFDGELKIDDPNLDLDFKGLVDVSEDANQFDFEADVTYAELNKLNLFTRDSVAVFAGRVIMDMEGTTIDNAVGTIEFLQTFYQNATEDYYFDDFLVVSSFQNSERSIEIISPDIINGKITGQFLIKDIPDLFVNGLGNLYTNYIPKEVQSDQYIKYDFEVYNKIIDVFVPELKLGDNTRIDGYVSSDETKFALDFKSPEILLFDNYLADVDVVIDNDNPLYNAFISVDSIYTGFYNFTDVNVINKTLNDTLRLRAEFKGGDDMDDQFNLSLYHTINLEGRSVVGVRKSDITFKDNVWYLNETNNNLNKVVFDRDFKTIRIDSLVLNHNDEVIQLAGVVRDSTYKDLKLRFNDVDIGKITPDIDSLRLRGNVNGRLNFLQKGGAYYPNSSVTIDGVVINQIPFGDLNLEISGNEDLSKYNINTSLVNNGAKSINAIGQIDVSANTPSIRLDVDLNEFNLQALSPFGGDVITDIRGLMSGNARVSGNYKSPDILGRFLVNGGGLKIPFLNTDFGIADNTRVTVTNSQFKMDATTITDTKYQTTGTFSGVATHKNFSDWALDLDVSTNRLLVLDTKPEEESLYYGTAFISGTADIVGPVDELEIDVFATTEEGTTFKIPLSDTETISDDSFIHFLSPKEKEALTTGGVIETLEEKGMTLNFDLDINDNAEVEVVVDQVNNSRLIGRGAGTLLIRINTLGKFQMWGDFLVIEGLFDFRYGGLIQKEIEVVPGGNITWDGQPERANLDLSARYETAANPSVLLDNPTMNRKIPVEVIVDLSGEIIQPDLNFRIDFPRVSSTLKSELEYVLRNEDERQKQALFLVATGSFVNDDYQGANAFTGTLVERVSGLVNELFADEDGKFAVGLDYTQATNLPNQETAGRVGVTLSTQINKRILINGKVGVPVGGVNETSVAGDIEVQWLVNEDGSLRINFFNRQADIQFIGEEQIFEQGAGVSYSVDFDTFSELVFKLFNKRLTLESENELPVIPDDNSYPVDFNDDAKLEEE
jgi:hypothetical protein